MPCRRSEYFQPLDTTQYTATYEKRLFGNKKYITFDIETYKDQTGRLIPYAVGSRVGGEGNYTRSLKEIKTYFILDFEGADMRTRATAMMFQAVKDLLNVRNRGYVVYCHNLGAFDGFLLIDYLKEVKHIKLKPLFRGGSMYSLDVSYPIDEMDAAWLEENKGTRGGVGKIKEAKTARIVFHDSYKILPQSLAALGKAFGCVTRKTEFPYDFVSEATLDYEGPAPEEVAALGKADNSPEATHAT